jgi:CRP/FNR family cyclic AMP-dependent transcriptional regulator
MTHTETDDLAQPATTPVMRTRALAESPTLAAKAVHFLSEGKFSFGLEKEEAQCVVTYLRWVSFSANAFLYREGDNTKTSYMLLLLEGDVSVDTGVSGRADRVAISVLGPGALIGEMALLDGAPRSTSCTAVTPVQAAGMSQGGLELLAKDRPDVAFKLMVFMARNTATRLRALGEQLHMYDQLIANLHQEVDQLRANKNHRG